MSDYDLGAGQNYNPNQAQEDFEKSLDNMNNAKP